MHQIGIVEHLDRIKGMEFAKDRMRTEEVVISNPKGNGVISRIKEFIAAGVAVGSFEGAVETFDHLLERTKLCGNGIIISEPDYLRDIEFEWIILAQSKLLSGKRISRIPVRNEAEVLRQGFEILKRHAHGHDARTDTTVIGNPVADDGTGNRIHDEPDVGFNTLDLDVGLISDKGGRLFEWIGHEKRAHESSGGSAIVFNRRVRDIDAVDFLESQCGFPQRKPQIDRTSQAKSHNMGVMLAELQGESILRK